jgi:general secretion pathway protein G
MGSSCSKRGFTLIELLIVMSILGLLLALAAPRYFNSLDRSKETALITDLRILREQIDHFYSDTGRYPRELAELVEARYLREVPVDPLTESRDTWVAISATETEGVADVRSGAEGQTRQGVPYAEL